MQTTVGIIGGGPAGLLLSYLLDRKGIDNIVLEHRSRTYVEARVRAGQLDHGSVTFLRQIGLAGRLDSRGMPQRGMNLRFAGHTWRIDLEEITGGRFCTVYGQSELTRDLIAALVNARHSPVFEALDVQLSAPDAAPHVIRYRHQGTEHSLRCRYVVGCDGAHGPTRALLNPKDGGHSRSLPFSWIGLLSETPPISRELTYVYHPDGFALWSMRSDQISRTYLQCGASDTVEDWPDDRFWEQMQKRLGTGLAVEPGRTTERVMVRMQGFVARSMHAGNVVLAGDAAHIVPPSAAKGLNLAIADVAALSESLAALLAGQQPNALARYAEQAMRRAWAVQHFSWEMTDLLHASPSGDPFENNLKLTQLDGLVSSPERLRVFCDAYTGAELSMP